MTVSEQLSFEDESEEYKAFVEKFKPKKTTDDCYTPQPVVDAVEAFVIRHYGIRKEQIVRPFWPGGSYEKYDYPEDCVVVDNPPFSILSKICTDFQNYGIRFFLYAPTLTNFSTGRKVKGLCHIVTNAPVTYENGAVVNTSFLTNMENGIKAMSCVELAEAVKEANLSNIKQTKNQPPKYRYDVHVLTSTGLGYMASHGVDYKLMENDCVFISEMDAQRLKKKAIFGGGFLLSEKAAAEKAAAEKAAAEKAATIPWELSEREKNIVQELSK